MTLAILEPMLTDFKPFSAAWIVQRVIDETRANPEMKQYGESKLSALRLLQRMPIGKCDARKLSRQDIIEFAKQRRAGYQGRKPVTPQTINQYLSYFGDALDYAGSTWDDCSDITKAPIVAAKPFLKKNGLIGKSVPRKRRPTDDEIVRLLDHFDKQAKHPKTKIRMSEVYAFALVASRRLGEICRITHGDVDYEKKVYWVRDLKHPTKKKGNDKPAVLWPELEEIIKRQPRMSDAPSERIFPFNSHSASQSFRNGRKKLGIVGLRFHDSRREAISRWLHKGLTPRQVAKAISLHETTTILERNYDGGDALEIVRQQGIAERMHGQAPV